MPNFVRSIHRVTEIHLAPSTGGGGWQILVSSGDDDFTVREHWVALNAGGNVALTIEDSVAEFEGIIPTPPGATNFAHCTHLHIRSVSYDRDDKTGSSAFVVTNVSLDNGPDDENGLCLQLFSARPVVITRRH